MLKPELDKESPVWARRPARALERGQVELRKDGGLQSPASPWLSQQRAPPRDQEEEEEKEEEEDDDDEAEAEAEAEEEVELLVFAIKNTPARANQLGTRRRRRIFCRRRRVF
jgi:hypothetical protein